MIQFRPLDPHFRPEHLGFIPHFLDERVPLPAWQQINDNYQHGGGWTSFKRHWNLDLATMTLRYPGDPSMKPIAVADLRDEQIFIYPYSWVLILQANMQWDLARID